MAMRRRTPRRSWWGRTASLTCCSSGVPEAKASKNRVHLDLLPAEQTRDQEVARLLELGATMVADHRRPDGTGWVVLADPEGNEFCVERSASERAAGQGAIG
jgi:hypothetical protein